MGPRRTRLRDQPRVFDSLVYTPIKAVPQLHLEIQLLVLRELLHDWQTFKTCSLVCRAWETFVRSISFYQTIVKVTRNHHPVVQELLELLRVSKTRVGRYIHALHFDGEWFDLEPSKSGKNYVRSPAINPQLVQQIVLHLPQLHSLFLTNIRLVSSGFRILPPTRSILTRLDISASVAEDDDLLDSYHLVYSFFNIRTLSLDFHYDGPPELLRPIPTKLPYYSGNVSVHSFLVCRLCPSWARAFYDFFLKVQQFDWKNFKCVCFYPHGELEELGAFLRLAGPDVRTLRLKATPMFVYKHNDLKNNWGKLNIASCTGLNAILFDLECRRYSAIEYPVALRIAFDAYVAALRHPDVRGRTTLKTVVLRATVYTMDNPIFSLDWDSMDRALEDLPMLETVFLGFTFDSLVPAMRLLELLPRTRKRGRMFSRLDLDEQSWTETYARPVTVETAMTTLGRF